MSWFNFHWFRSKEREELKASTIQEAQKKWDFEDIPDQEISIYPIPKPYKNIYFDGTTLTVVFHDGTFCSKIGTRELLDQIRDARERKEILSLLYPNITENVIDTKEDKEFILANSAILKDHPDFVINGLNINMKGISLTIPSIIVASFIEMLEKEDNEKYQALKAFWMWLALNPIESSRNDALTFIKKNDVNITKNGLLELYRRVVNVGEKNKELSQFISNQYFRVKKWKKAPKNYNVYDIDGALIICDLNGAIDNSDKVTGHSKGNLESLYLNLPNMQENIYTDSHTKTKIIKVGYVYKEDEDRINLSNGLDCAEGLHIGGHSFLFDSFGDTGVLALVNPSKIRSVPASQTNKMRVSEMFIAAVVDINDYKSHIEEAQLIDYSQEYYNQSVEELEQLIKQKDYSLLECQDNLPAVSMIDINTIKNELKTRVKSVNICQ